MKSGNSDKNPLENSNKNKKNNEITQRKDRKNTFPLSLNQEGLWLTDKLYPKSNNYLLFYSFTFDKKLDINLLKKSFEKLLERHVALKTYFDLIDNEPKQFIIDRIDVDKFFNYQESSTEKQVHETFQKEILVPISLNKWPLFKVHICKVKDEYFLLFIIHHIIFDSKSADIFFKELTEIYNSLLNNKNPTLPKISFDYKDFAMSQRKEENSQEIKKELEFWKNNLLDSQELLEIPLDHPRPSIFTGKGEIFNFKLSSKLVKNLQNLAKKLNISYFDIMLSAFFVLIFRHSNQEDLTIGTPFDHRNQISNNDLIGLLVQFLPIRQKINPKLSFLEFSKQISKTFNEVKSNSDCSFESIVKSFNLQRNPSFNPIFQVVFEIEKSTPLTLNLQNVKTKIFNLNKRSSFFDIYLKLSEEGHGFIEYYNEIFDEATIQRMMNHFEILLENIVLDSNCAIDLIPIMSNEEKKKICIEWNKNQTPYPRDSSIVEVFEKIVKKYPQNIALRFDSVKVGYEKLNEDANRLANYLIKIGVKKNEYVGISLDKSIDLIVGIIAILKAGGIYVPIDASYPNERKHFMVNDTKIKVLIIQEDFISQYSNFDLKFVCINKIQHELKKFSLNNLNIKIDPLDGAYVNYTSGSTGKPKGVEVLNRGVLRLVLNTNWIEVSIEDRIAQISNISFDLTTFEVWGSLLNGASLCIYPHKRLDLEEMGNFLINQGVTNVIFSAKFFSLMVDEQLENLKNLKFIHSTGDVMSLHHAKKAFKTLKNCNLINCYGPTENATYTTAYTIKDLKNIEISVPIGKPISNTSVYILDKNLNLVAIGVIGELYTGGDGVAKGYLNREDITKERFIKDPFSKDPNAKMYKSGDLARYLPDGNIIFHGRADTQVKIRGFRIELGEIEEILKKIKGVFDSICLISEEKEGEKQLVAYVEGKKDLDPIEIRKSLVAKLPQHMIPDYIIVLEKFPVTPVGKINRKAFPSPREVLSEEKKDFEEPKTPIEKLIADVWISLLKIPKISRKDNFFYIGGHSINAAQLASILSKSLGKSIPVTLIFENSTLEKYALKVEEILSGKKEILKDDQFLIWRNKEVTLDPLILSEKLSAPKDYQYSNPKNVFITGSTGFIGSFLLQNLLEKTQANIYCHIRASSEKDGFEALKKVMKNYDIWDEKFSKKIIIVKGDLEKKLLGIDPSYFEDLTDKIDSIFHIGAFVNHVLPYEKLKPANVLGTEEIIRLAMTKKLKPLHFTSTVDVLPHKDEIEEDEDLNNSKDLFNGYAQSKWVSEKIIELAKTKGLKANIYRLHRISGSSKVGSGPIIDFLWRMVQACIHLKAFPKVNVQENLTPVDFIVDSMLEISKQKDFINKHYNLFNPNAFTYESIFKILIDLGYKMQKMNFVDWRNLLIKESLKEGEEKLLAIVPVFEMEIFQENQKINFKNENVKKALKDKLKIPEINEKIIKLYVDYYVKIGYLPPYA